MSRLVVQVQVLRKGELFLSRQVVTPCVVTVGPDAAATIPTTALKTSLRLLGSSPGGGLGVRLAPPLEGVLSVGERRLRVVEGLLVDPRPEPLSLGAGDSGSLKLDDALELQFFIHRMQPGFGLSLQLDRGLLIALAAASLAAIALLVAMAPWSWSPRLDPTRVVERRLTHRPAILDLTHPRPPRRVAPAVASSKQASPRHSTASRRRSRPPGRADRRRHAVLNALKQNPRLAGLLRPGGARAVDRALRGLDQIRTLTSTAMPGLQQPRGLEPTRDRLLDLLGNAQSDLGKLGGVSRGGPSPSPSLAAALPRRRLAAARLVDRSGPTTGVSREAVRKVVVVGSAAVRLCYERELISSNRPLEGRILLRWRINGEGKVRDLAVVKDALGSTPLRQCIMQRVSGWRFPSCPGPATCTVVYPFDFFPKMS